MKCGAFMVNVECLEQLGRGWEQRGMSFFISNNGGLSEDEVSLGKPDEMEAKNLKHHTAKCALRYSIFTRRMASQGQDIVQIKYMMIVLIGIMFLTAPQMRPFFEWFTKLFS